LISLGFCIFGSVAFQEYLEFHVDWPDWSLGIRAAIEEGSELLGMFLCLAGIVHQHHQQQCDRSSIALQSTLSSKHLQGLILSGLLLHILASIWVSDLRDLPDRGNPALWYPVAVYCMLSHTVLRDYFQVAHPKGVMQLGLGVNCLAFSLLMGCYKYPLESLDRLHFYYGPQFFLITLFYAERFREARKQIAISISILTSFLLISAVWKCTVLSFSLASFFAYCIASLYLRQTGHRLRGH
jgi:hypothetical protein